MTTRRTITVDIAAHDLATSFLSDHPPLDTPAHRQQLAEDIQQAIEDFFFAHEADVALGCPVCQPAKVSE